MRSITLSVGQQIVLIIILALFYGGFSMGGYLIGEKCGNAEILKEFAEKKTEFSKPLSEWEMLEMAIIKTESEFNPQAIGKTDDVGIFQITPIFVKETNRIIDSTKYTAVDAFNISKSLEMFNIVQSSRNPEQDIEKAISIHNPNGNAIGYADRVLTNLRYIKRMEEVRGEIVKIR